MASEQAGESEQLDPAGSRCRSDASLTVAEVAARMRVSKMTVYRLVHSGELPATRVGRSYRVPRAAVEEHLRDVYFDTD